MRDLTKPLEVKIFSSNKQKHVHNDGKCDGLCVLLLCRDQQNGMLQIGLAFTKISSSAVAFESSWLDFFVFSKL